MKKLVIVFMLIAVTATAGWKNGEYRSSDGLTSIYIKLNISKSWLNLYMGKVNATSIGGNRYFFKIGKMKYACVVQKSNSGIPILFVIGGLTDNAIKLGAYKYSGVMLQALML